MTDRPDRRSGAPPDPAGPAAGAVATQVVTGVPLGVPSGLAATLVLVRHGQSTWLAEGRFQGQADPPLSPLGRRQARLVGARLVDPWRPPRLPIPRGRPIAIVHSPLARTRETAGAIADALAGRDGTSVDGRSAAAATNAGSARPPLVPDPGFAEIAQGEWEGLLQAEVEARYPDLISGWRRDPAGVHAPGGESLAEAASRVRAALGRILDRLQGASGPAPEPAGRTHSIDPVHGVSPSALVPSYYAGHSGPWAVVVGHDGAFKLAILALLGLPLDRFWSFTQQPAALAVVDLRNGRAILRAWNRTDHLAALEVEDVAPAVADADADDRSRSGAL